MFFGKTSVQIRFSRSQRPYLCKGFFNSHRGSRLVGRGGVKVSVKVDGVTRSLISHGIHLR